MTVSTQIAVRLPDDLVAWIDEQVSAGEASRAAITAKALRRYQRQVNAERDAQIYRETGGYPDLYEWAGTDRTYPRLD
jgi:Arc/MetJ-type ribon-helix-helix transcriptional regulator